MKARVLVRLKTGVLDPQGVAIALGLTGLGFPPGLSVRQGKLFEIDLGAAYPSADAAREAVRAMCERLLANTIIESYEITIEEGRP